MTSWADVMLAEASAEAWEVTSDFGPARTACCADTATEMVANQRVKRTIRVTPPRRDFAAARPTSFAAADVAPTAAVNEMDLRRTCVRSDKALPPCRDVPTRAT